MPQFVLSLLFMVLLLPVAASVAAQPEQLTLRLYTEHSPPGEYLDARESIC